MARRARRKVVPAVPRVFGYIRVSTAEQGVSHAGLDAQLAAIQSECERRGWSLVHVYEDVASGKGRNGRHQLRAALGALAAGEAEILCVQKIDRLTRSPLDFYSIIGQADKEGWRVVSLDLAVDMTTPMGEAIAGMAMTFARLERRLIGDRTRAALAIRRSQGVKLGRPRTLPAKVAQRIVRERSKGAAWQAIADRLNADAVPTAQGGQRWYAATARKVHLGAGR